MVEKWRRRQAALRPALTSEAIARQGGRKVNRRTRRASREAERRPRGWGSAGAGPRATSQAQAVLSSPAPSASPPSAVLAPSLSAVAPPLSAVLAQESAESTRQGASAVSAGTPRPSSQAARRAERRPSRSKHASPTHSLSLAERASRPPRSASSSGDSVSASRLPQGAARRRRSADTPHRRARSKWSDWPSSVHAHGSPAATRPQRVTPSANSSARNAS
mmetsp:Transcript_73444/g.191623  ORF Transcript_73444/g.191623 Transcript_73444/m.191623 type:complete len:220 (-) Transcript_73444:645-1304(-)